MRAYGYPLEFSPYSRNPVDYPSNDQELQTTIVKRKSIPRTFPRQIRRLAKNAK